MLLVMDAFLSIGPIPDTGMCHNFKCWRHSSVSQLLVSSILLNKGKNFLPTANFGMKHMHLHAFYPEWHLNLRYILNLINASTIKETADKSKVLGILTRFISTHIVGEIDWGLYLFIRPYIYESDLMENIIVKEGVL